MKTAPKCIVVIGHRWFERTNGNTYHSVTVHVDGKLIERVPFTYGYGNHFEQTASNVLADAGFVPRGTYPLGTYCQEHGICYVSEVADVSRKKDL